LFNRTMLRALLVFVLLVTGASAAEMPDDTVLSTAASARAAGRFAAAAEQYRELALKEPDSLRSAEAHRLAILCTADLLRESAPADRPPIAQLYETLLQEHLRVWPAQATADDVRMWQGRLLEVRRDWPAAITVFQQVRPASKHYAESLRLAAEGYDQQLRRLDTQSEDGKLEQARLLAAATKSFQPIITGPQNRWPNPWIDVQRDVAVELARLHVRYGAPASPYAVQLLSAALRGAPAAAASKSQDWQTTARVLLIAALARNGKIADAQAIASQLTVGPPDLLLEALAIVVEQMPPAASSNATQKELGQLALALVKLIDAQDSEFDSKSRTRLNDCRAAAMAAVGDRTAALALYAALAAQSPNDGDVQERYAALLAASDSPDEMRQALARWQTVETRSRRGGDRWRRARHARIDLLTRLGETAEAEKFLRLSRLQYPDWDATPAN